PVATVGEDDGSLLVAERLDGLERLGVGADVDDGVLQAMLLQGTVGGIALHTGGLTEDGDGHGAGSPSQGVRSQCSGRESNGSTAEYCDCSYKDVVHSSAVFTAASSTAHNTTPSG